ncbi:MAG: AAA family ATPase [Gammaproteobacteria bacterium]|nr:AAA family ATPase [Gammaproteobacteria bacterium]
MYESFFGLKDRPFSIAPDPRFLFMSPRHKEALAHLAYGIRHGAGFVLLTGEVGTGKTTICRQILRKLPENTRLAFILNPMLNAKELLATLCDELGVDYSKENFSLKDLTDNLTRFLLQCHQEEVNVVLMIDEAQNLQPEVLEQIRLLTNLETDQRKLLQIILVGQPELQELLARKQLRQLAQRVTARYHLRPLNQVETVQYIQHRLRIAGTSQTLFSKQGTKAVFSFSEGIPRLINNLCDRAMMAAYSEEKKTIAEKHVKAAAKEALPMDLVHARQLPWYTKWPTMVGAGVGVLAAGYFIGMSQSTSSEKQANVSAITTNVQRSNPQDESLTNAAAADSAIGLPSQAEQQSAGNANNQTVIKNEEPSINDRDGIYRTIFSRQEDPEGFWAQSFLAKRWKLDYDETIHGDFCQFANDYSLKCDSGLETWGTIIEYNRPVNLSVENNAGDTSWLTLHQFNGEQVEIETPMGRRWIKLDWLLSVWTREYQLLWQAPPGYRRPIRRGDNGVQVDWLIERLTFLFPQEVGDSKNFNRRIEQVVKSFQQRHGLKSDGIAGMNTLIQLNTSTTAGMPVLK